MYCIHRLSNIRQNYFPLFNADLPLFSVLRCQMYKTCSKPKKRGSNSKETTKTKPILVEKKIQETKKFPAAKGGSRLFIIVKTLNANR